MKVGDLITTIYQRVSVREPTLGWAVKWHEISCDEIGLVLNRPIENEYTTLVLFGDKLYYILPREFRVVSSGQNVAD